MVTMLDPSIPSWPRFLSPESVAPLAPMAPIIVGPQPLSGTPQTTQGDTGYLRLQLVNLALYDAQTLGAPNRRRAFRALWFTTLAQGLPIYMPFYEWWRGPRLRVGLPPFGSAVPLSDGATLSDTTDFAQSAGDAILTADAALRATTIVVTMTSAAVPQADDPITIGDRAYIITGATPDPTIAGQWSFTIWPPLRAAASAGDAVEVAEPFCRMVLDPKDRQQAPVFQGGRVASITLTFNEANFA